MRTTASAPNDSGRDVPEGRAAAARRGPRTDPSAGEPEGAPRLIILGNGHGEDEIGATLVEEFRRQIGTAVRLTAWAMVGRGKAYDALRVERIGTPNLLPSEGFGTLSAGAFARDVRAGWLRVHRRQLHDARALRGRFDFALAIGDVVPILAASLARVPFALVGCAKSVYYGTPYGYDAVERWLLRRGGAVCYARDALTAAALARTGVAATYVGNPMMDRVATTDTVPPRVVGPTVVACLPGSRNDRETNAARILGMIAAAAPTYEDAGSLHFAFALPPHFDRLAMRRALHDDGGGRGWEFGVTAGKAEETVEYARCGVLHASFVDNSIGAVLGRARVAIALAGTANEQAVGLGVPVVTFATTGVQGDYYLRMKMPYFGESALQVEAAPQPLADAVCRIVRHDSLHARMAAAGRARMGTPGGSAAIVSDVLRRMLGSRAS